MLRVPVVPPEYLLLLGYALSLALIALVLELTARHALRRSLESSTVGFTYHPSSDVWKCPRDQHLFPVFSDHADGIVIYRAPASACNCCGSKTACTDSDNGREIERHIPRGLEYGMQRFHRAMSLTLMALASLMLAVEFFRAHNLYLCVPLLVVLIFFCAIIKRLASGLRSANTVRKEFKQKL